LAQHKFAHSFGQFVNIVGIQIKAEGIAARYQPPFDCFRQMDLTALIIGQHAVIVRSTPIGEAEPAVKTLTRIEVNARKNSYHGAGV
jgi:hypothetical protein